MSWRTPANPSAAIASATWNNCSPNCRPTVADLLPAAGATTLEFQPGWRRDELSLSDALLLARDRDRTVGFTSSGPHRADWRIGYAAFPGREALSRGQAKLTALAILLAQAELHADLRGEWPIIALDDLASELDRNHQARVLARLQASGAQVFITGTEAPAALQGTNMPTTRFHVEQGQIHPEAAHAPSPERPGRGLVLVYFTHP